MSLATHPFDAATAIDPLDDAGPGDASSPVRFRTVLNREWWVARGPNGGYVAAVMLRAMEAVAAGRTPRSLTVQYARAPREGEAEVEVRTVRAGKSVTFLSATMEQDGETMLSALGVFGGEREGRLNFAGRAARIPDADGSGEMVRLEPDTPGVPAVIANFEMALAIGEQPFSRSGGEARTGGWIRPAEPRLVDAALATAILDVWFPAPFVKLDRPAAAPTLDFTVHYRTSLPLPEAREDDRYLIEVTTSESREGHFEEDARLWHPGGTLLAHSRQLALL